ncbi:MAG TPA: ComEC/Rec2 family competence protein, partial [Nitrospira sp.]
MLPFLTFAFIAGLALGSLIPYYPLAVSVFLCLLAIGLSLLEAKGRMTAVAATASFACVLCGILYWFQAVEGRSKATFHESEPETFQSCIGRVVAPVQYSPGRMLMVVRCDAEESGRSLLLRLTWRGADRRIFQGDRISLRAKLRSPTGSLNPGGFNYAAYLEQQGIDAVASVNGLEAIDVLESGNESLRWKVWNRVDRWRDAIRLSALNSLEPPALGLFLGVVIGERGYLDPDVRDQFMITGTVHLLSISGSHLGLVAMLSFSLIKHGCLWLPASWLLRISRRITPTRLAAAATLFPATVYACLAGAEVATVRSLVMVFVALAAKWLGYEQRIFHALGAAALAIVLHDPKVIYDISFQLSFLSVGAVGWRLSQSSWREEEDIDKPSRLASARLWATEALIMSAV